MRAFPHLRCRGATVALAAALLSACQATPEIPEITLGAGDFTFALPDTIPGGLVRVHFTNDGREDHHAQFIRLNDGVTRTQFDSVFAEVMAAVPTEGEVAFMRLFEIATVEGGPAPVAPGGRSDVILDLTPGEYVLACFIPSPDGTPHLAKGMRRWVTVAAPPAGSPAPPVAAGRVDMADFTFAPLPAMDSGLTVLEVTNSGQEPHEMAVMRLEGATLDQVLAMMMEPPPAAGAGPSGPLPFRFVGGLQAIRPGDHGWVMLDLSPGDYALLCFVPSPAHEGRPHIGLGMVRAFTVSQRH